MMETLADSGNGNYAYVDDLDEARKLFVEDLTSTLQVIALDAKVQVDFNPEVVAYYRLIGYENRDVRLTRISVMMLSMPVKLAPVTVPPSNCAGRPSTPDSPTRTVTEINGNFNTWDLAGSFEQADPRYQLAVIAAQYAELLRPSPWAAETNGSQLVDHAYRISSLLFDDAEVAEFASLVSQASQISALGN